MTLKICKNSRGSEMTERPILFSAPMVRAILDNQKTQTRRVVKPTVKGCTIGSYFSGGKLKELVNTDPDDGDPVDGPEIVCPYGQPGDQLWVREFCPLTENGRETRIQLEITGVRVERLNEISEADAGAEGIREVTKDGVLKKYCVLKDGDMSDTPWADMPRTATEAYRALWNSINGPDSWDLNPWVGVIEFKRIAPEVTP